MIRPQYLLGIDDELIAVIFAGMGGMCHAIEVALGRHVDIACNHNPFALAVHRINHRQTKHYICDVYELDPNEACGMRYVGHLHLSSDCTDHSQSAAGQPRDVVSRSLTWAALMWVGKLKKSQGRGPRVITLENVKRLRKWGPLIAKRCETTGRVIKIDPETRRIVGVAEPGERVPVREQFLVADPKHEGRRWRRFLSLLRGHGYHVEDSDMVAADYGTPTSRDRLFMVARCDGQPIVWPVPTHAKKPVRPMKRWRSAAECIDWTIPVRSIFARPRPLVDATCRRIARGIMEFVVNHPDPFVVPELLPPNELHANRACAFMAQHNGGNYADNAGHDMRQPFSTFTGRGTQQQVVTANMLCLRNNCYGGDARAPVPVIAAGGEHHGVVECTLYDSLTPEQEAGALRCASFLIRYYSQGGQWGDLRDPMPTITTKARLALVTVWIRGTPRVIVDIGMRMFAARELANGMGFLPSFIIDRGLFELPDGRLEERPITATIQKELIGNAVAREPAEALILANLPDLSRYEKGERKAIA